MDSIKNIINIRGLSVSPPVAMAPMVGLSHTGFRSLLVELGGVGLFYTEMLAAKRLPHDNEHISPLLITSKEESPLFYQLITAEAKYIEPAMDKVHRLGGQGVDLNLGCPAPMQKRQGAGASLSQDYERLKTVLSCLRKSTQLPLSVKIRLGVDLSSTKLIDYCQMLIDHGVDMITIHARLHGEKFCRKPRWSMVGAVRETIKVPLFVNGGIFSVDDARRCLEQSGADGLMLGRGALERPWLCSEIAEEVYGYRFKPGIFGKKEIYFRFVELLEQRMPTERQLGRLKRFTNYYSASFSFGHHLAAKVQSSSSMAEAKEKAEEYFVKSG